MPTGNDVTQRSALKPAFSEDLFERVLQRDNLKSAWNRVRANKGAAGIDGMTIDEFLDWAKSGGWRSVVSDLEAGRYRPSPVRRVEIDKPDGGIRQLGIPTVIDRVDHDLLMTHLGYKVKDKRLLRLVSHYLRAGIIDNQFFSESREGVPQGGPLSPLLANILLDSLDKELEKRGHRFARYADDFTILVKSRRAGERVLRSISQYLQSRLKLVINTTKSHVVKTNESRFLGFTFRRGRIHWHSKTRHKFKQEIRRLTNRNWGVSMKYQLFKTSQYLRGWINYFGIANCYQLCVDLDHWIRRRVRMAYWRQWRKPRTKVRSLMKLGVRVQSAVACGTTSKGPWCSSKTPGIQEALSNAFLESQGLYELRDGWIKLHHSK